MRKLCILLPALLLFAAGARAEMLWMEAEQFKDPGGWSNDPQFIDQMGSPYLLASSVDGPVKDAVTTIDARTPGNYRLWVRSKDWYPQASPGRFEVIINGKRAARVFGESKQTGWRWEDGGTAYLPAGHTEVRLHDLTGYYGRCDALLFCNDLNYEPPSDKGAIEKLREGLGGVSAEPAVKHYDVVVVGGGLAGTVAAVAAARYGMTVALIQDRPLLGGNASDEIMVPPSGDHSREYLDPGETGIIEEIRRRPGGSSKWLLWLAQKEPSLDLYLNTHANGVVMKSPDTIGSVQALQVSTGRRYLFAAQSFIDATGDGSIGVFSGAEYRHGREPRSMYGESRAPVKADDYTMGSTLRYGSEKLGHPVKFDAVPWARKYPECSDFGPGRHPKLTFGAWQWVIEYGGSQDTYAQAEEVRDELLRIIWGIWDHLKNHCTIYAKDAPFYKLAWVTFIAGKRESQRLIGDEVVTEKDVTGARLFPDRVAYGGFGLDIHDPDGFDASGPPSNAGDKNKFSIPFGSLYSKNISNLMMAGRDISASHVALGATRVAATNSLQGQAVGTAAYLCKLYDETPRGIRDRHLSELQQQLLKGGCYLIDLPNGDPADIARTAVKVTASSTAPASDLTPDLGDPLDLHELTTERAVAFKVTSDRLDQFRPYLLVKSAKPVQVKAVLRSAASLDHFGNGPVLGSATVTLQPHSRGWIDFNFHAHVKPGGLYFVTLEKAPEVFWTLFSLAPHDTARGVKQGSSEWKTPDDACYAFRLKPENDQSLPEPPSPPGARPAGLFAAASVINGYSRAVRSYPDAWRPAPDKPFPQWVQLDFGKPVEFNTVHVNFQTRLLLADKFEIQAAAADGTWKSLAKVTGNDMRRRVLTFPRTRSASLRLVLLDAPDDTGVTEIRVYNESDDDAVRIARSNRPPDVGTTEETSEQMR